VLAVHALAFGGQSLASDVARRIIKRPTFRLKLTLMGGIDTRGKVSQNGKPDSGDPVLST
jgi:hypothetical protein